MKKVIEAQKIDGVKICRSEEVHICASCGYDLDEAELAADTCSNCGAPLKLKKSVSVWATSLPKAGAKTWGQQ
jgi:predicted amidophosphoribosyltransferase